MVADVGNRSDVYRAINFARQYGMNKEDVGGRILVIRAFTVPQVTQLLSIELPKIIRKYHVRSVFVPGLLNAFDEAPNMRVKEMKKEIGRIMRAVKQISAKVLVVTSTQESKYAEWILPEFKKRTSLGQEKH
jgi:hypothetical protein